eukprot:g8442.t1
MAIYHKPGRWNCSTGAREYLPCAYFAENTASLNEIRKTEKFDAIAATLPALFENGNLTEDMLRAGSTVDEESRDESRGGGGAGTSSGRAMESKEKRWMKIGAEEAAAQPQPHLMQEPAPGAPTSCGVGARTSAGRLSAIDLTAFTRRDNTHSHPETVLATGDPPAELKGFPMERKVRQAMLYYDDETGSDPWNFPAQVYWPISDLYLKSLQKLLLAALHTMVWAPDGKL